MAGFGPRTCQPKRPGWDRVPNVGFLGVSARTGQSADGPAAVTRSMSQGCMEPPEIGLLGTPRRQTCSR